MPGIDVILAANEHPAPRIAPQINRAETGFEADHLTGDWHGVRTRLVDQGFHFSASYTGEFISNVHGGKKEGTVFQGLFDLGLDIDPSKFSAWKNALIHTSSLYPHGASSSGQLVGDLSTVSNIDAYDSWILFEWWLDQTLFQDRLSLRLGQLAADEEFVTSDYSDLFINATFGWPSFVAWNTPAPAYPLAAPGIRLRYEFSRQFFLHAGVFDGSPDHGDSQGNPLNTDGTHIHLDSQQGAFTVGEAVWRTLGNVPGKRETYPGTYKLGVWHHTGGFEPIFDAQPNQPPPGPLPEQSGDVGGIYLMGDQKVWSESGAEPDMDQGMGVFFRFSAGPPTRNVIDYYADAGMVYQGLLPGRDEDTVGWGVSYAHLSRQARDLARMAGAPQLSFEVALEITYKMKISDWWLIQPDLQYVIHPGGQSSRSNAFVLGLRTSIIF
jgi:porin